MTTLSQREKFLAVISADSLKKSDAIILLEGDGFYRIPKAMELLDSGWARVIVISGGILNPDNGSLPASDIKDQLIGNGVSEADILTETMSMNTREQALNVIKMANNSGWRRIILVASHYHQYRAYLTFLKVILDMKSGIEIVNAPANTLSWFEINKWGSRFDLLENEFEKIESYSKAGHIATYSQAIEYQRWKELQA
ncbi:MAG: YdcF family protein [Bacteroidales bacterium]